MPVVVGVDLGTSKISALAVETATGAILARHTLANQAETTSAEDRARSRSEWDARQITATAGCCLRALMEQLGAHPVVGLGITGQQHGVVVVDRNLTPLTPFINWQDRRGDEIVPGTQATYVRQAIRRVGERAPERTGCRLATGYLAVTLFWLNEHRMLPVAGTACFIMDYFGACLTGRTPVTDATCAASSGVLDAVSGKWDVDLIAGLGLPPTMFPELRSSGARLGGVIASASPLTGLPPGLPVFVAIGDNQASFVGSVASREDSILVNVGTGGQVTAYRRDFVFDPLLETRPYPGDGYLLVCAGLSGGQAYAVLERFFRQVAVDILGTDTTETVYETLNRLAARVPPGCEGLCCEPFFTGTRQDPNLRASWTGISTANFTPAHLTRALLEGMARIFHGGYRAIVRHLHEPRSQLIGAGNGLRENDVLAQIVADEFGLPLRLPAHREEAAFGAALVAAVGVGAFPDLAAAGRLIHYGEPRLTHQTAREIPCPR